jgi:hypothetical protein
MSHDQTIDTAGPSTELNHQRLFSWHLTWHPPWWLVLVAERSYSNRVHRLLVSPGYGPQNARTNWQLAELHRSELVASHVGMFSRAPPKGSATPCLLVSSICSSDAHVTCALLYRSERRS